MIFRRFLLFVLLIFLFNIITAQEADSTQHKLKLLERIQEKHAYKEKEGLLMITPVVGPGYTPELGFSLAGGALFSFKTNKKDALLPRSSIPVTIGMSTTGAFFGSAKATTFWKGDKIRNYTDVWVKSMPDNFFGVGYDDGHDTPKSDSTTKYKRNWFQINPRVLWQFRKNYFIGGAIDMNFTHGRNPSAGVENDPNFIAYNDRPFNVGLGADFQIDSRDVTTSPWKGWFFEAQFMAYGKYFGGDNNYETFIIDARRYIQLFKPGQLLALQIKTRLTTGEVPYGEMSQLGTPFDLRGYLWGQYRDKCMLFGLAEYRHAFYKRNGKRSRHEVIAWVGGGSIASNLAFENWLPNAGIGYRLEVQPRMALRLDFGIGKPINTAHGFYFNFNEAY